MLYLRDCALLGIVSEYFCGVMFSLKFLHFISFLFIILIIPLLLQISDKTYSLIMNTFAGDIHDDP